MYEAPTNPRSWERVYRTQPYSALQETVSEIRIRDPPVNFGSHDNNFAVASRLPFDYITSFIQINQIIFYLLTSIFHDPPTSYTSYLIKFTLQIIEFISFPFPIYFSYLIIY